jgi:hypothetical protein
VFRVTARCQRLVALGAAEAGAVPVFTQRRLPLGCGHRQDRNESLPDTAHASSSRSCEQHGHALRRSLTTPCASTITSRKVAGSRPDEVNAFF